jgi:hypothetical protein
MLPQHPNYCRPKTLNPKQEIARVGRQYDGTKVNVATQQTTYRVDLPSLERRSAR